MRTVQLRQAKARLSSLVNAAQEGETTVLTKHGRPVAKLVPFDNGQPSRPQKRPDLIEWLRSMPADIPFERDQTPPRVVEF